MKKLLPLIVCFIITTSSQAQLYYHAKSLANTYDTAEGVFEKDSHSTFQILKSYFPSIGDTLSNKALGNNQFINVKKEVAISNGVANLLAQNPFTPFSSLAGIDVTTITDGLAQFLAERTKEELNIAFFERFRKLLIQYPELGKTFPTTSFFLSTIYNFDYAHLIPTLREAFEKDLLQLPNNLLAIAQMDSSSECEPLTIEKQKKKCKVRIDAIAQFFKSEAGGAVLIALNLSQATIEKNFDPIAIINNIGNIELDNKNMQGFLKLTQIVSNSFVSTKAGQFYISNEEFNQLTTDSNLRKMFLGLLYQEIKNKKIEFDGKPLTEYFKPEKTAVLMEIITDYCKTIALIRNDASAIQSDTSSPKNPAKVAALLGDFQLLLKQTKNWQKLDSSLSLPINTKTVFNATDLGISLSSHILTKNYFAAILDATQLMNLVSDKKPNYLNKYDTSRYEIKARYLQQLTKYGTFAASIVGAKNSSEVKDAIKAVALPPGSSSIKKNTNFSIALQAYVGGIYAVEFSEGGKTNTFAPYAPIGISFSMGLKTHKYSGHKCNAGSLSAMVQLIDIGAMVAYRFNRTDSLPESVKLRFENIFAPGLSIVYGIPKVPLSIGGGFQWMPSNFGNSFYKKYSVQSNSGIRAQLFLAVDIPMFNLFATQR